MERAVSVQFGYNWVYKPTRYAFLKFAKEGHLPANNVYSEIGIYLFCYYVKLLNAAFGGVRPELMMTRQSVPPGTDVSLPDWDGMDLETLLDIRQIISDFQQSDSLEDDFILGAEEATPPVEPVLRRSHRKKDQSTSYHGKILSLHSKPSNIPPALTAKAALAVVEKKKPAKKGRLPTRKQPSRSVAPVDLYVTGKKKGNTTKNKKKLTGSIKN